MPTSDEQQRTDSPQFDFQLRFYVRGRHGYMDDSGIVVGSDYDVSAATTTTDEVTADSTSIPVLSTASFPSSGLICIGPLGEFENHNIVYYGSKTSTTFDDLEWTEVQITPSMTNAETDTFHLSGAPVTQWVDVTHYITGTFNLQWGFTTYFAIWNATIRGITYNSRLFRRDNTVLIKWRFRPSSGVLANWTGWKVACVGYIRTVTGRDDYQRYQEWTAQIEGFSQYILRGNTPPHIIGKHDLASGKSVTVSSYLDRPEAEENSGEFVGAPNLDGDNAVDDDISTLWISEMAPAVTALTKYGNEWRINEVYLEAATGQPELQWIELFCQNNEGGIQGKLVSEATTWHEWQWNVEPNPENPPIYWYWSGPLSNYLNLGFIHGMEVGSEFLILCSNLPEFERRWRLLGGALVDWRTRQIGTFQVDKTGDFIALTEWEGFKPEDSNAGIRDAVWFGSITPADFGATAHCNPWPKKWSGGTVTLPADGNTIARTSPGLDTDTAADWDEETAPSPGAYADGDEEWLSIDLGALNILLTAQLSAEETTEMEVSSTLGLTESGYVIIDGEIIGYQTRDDANLKLLTLTRGVAPGDPAEVHLVDALVEPYEDGIGYNCHLVDAVQWKRRTVYNGTTLVVPMIYEWYISDDATVIYPDDEDWDDEISGWKNYWERFSFDDAEGDHTCPSQLHQVGPIRARHAMLVIREMSDGGRAKVNEVNIFSATAETVDGDSGTEDTLDGAASGYIIRQLFADWGLPNDQFTMDDEGRQFARMNSERGSLERIVGDLLERTSCVLIFSKDENITHRTSPFHPFGALPTAEYTWSRANLMSVEWDEQDSHRISQVQLRARDAVDNDVVYEVHYPPEPLALGDIMVIDDYVFGGTIHDGLKFAEQIFRRENGPLTGRLYPIGPAEWVVPGQRHLVTWDLDEMDVLLSGRNFIVQSVRWDIGLGDLDRDKTWKTTIEIEELMY